MIYFTYCLTAPYFSLHIIKLHTMNAISSALTAYNATYRPRRCEVCKYPETSVALREFPHMILCGNAQCYLRSLAGSSDDQTPRWCCICSHETLTRHIDGEFVCSGVCMYKLEMRKVAVEREAHYDVDEKYEAVQR